MVPAPYSSRYVYHFTHLSNLKNVLTYGFLSCNEQRRLGLGHTSIAEDSIQKRRSQMVVTCGPGGTVHDYVPLYFGKLSPMLLRQVSVKNVDQQLIIYFVFPIQLVERNDVVFTSAAANTVRPPRFFSDPARLADLRWDAIDHPRWKSSDDAFKQARMAEVLVHTRLDPRAAAYLVVWDNSIADQIKAIYADCGLQAPGIRFAHADDGGYWFTHLKRTLPPDMFGHSLATGPIFTKYRYEAALRSILENRGTQPSARFRNVYELLGALRTNLLVLPETGELVGLESHNEVHHENVGDHTLRVVANVRGSNGMQRLEPNEQLLVELAAYLHDIGKGPKSRWVRCDGKQQVDADHPIRSAEMLPRILTQEVQSISNDEARILCKLVCYHDLYGDIVGKGRRQEQLADIAENARDLEMLITIGQADMSAVADSWGDEGEAQENELREWALQKMRGR